ncbi:uncharacterized protein LOC114737630 [Neltuma alba]|uniref:uncharacterized protein LOC114737630 n=1 Tax=Neltuma alba TaxID=207710 RepID=UPI0010A58AA8|nr:uncharacterized protein LOC114737630 [Prosopis alba]
MVCWWLWRCRNLTIFKGKWITNEAVIANANALITNLSEVQKHLSTVPLQGVRRVEAPNRWQPLEEGWIKLNVDGAFSAITDSVACRGAMRNSAGNFLRGFIYKLDEGDALSAKLWTCLHGLKIAWDDGHRNVILESGATNVIELLNVEPKVCHADYNVLQEVRTLLSRNWNVRLGYVNRECNKAADFLAKRGLEAMQGFHFVTNVPSELASILNLDCTTVNSNMHVEPL